MSKINLNCAVFMLTCLVFTCSLFSMSLKNDKEYAFSATDVVMCSKDLPSEVIEIILTRLEQLSCGFIEFDDETTADDEGNNRALDADASMFAMVSDIGLKKMNDLSLKNTVRLRNHSSRDVIVIISTIADDDVVLKEDTLQGFSLGIAMPSLHFKKAVPDHLAKRKETLRLMTKLLGNSTSAMKAAVFPLLASKLYVSFGIVLKYENIAAKNKYCFQFYAAREMEILVESQFTIYQNHFVTPLSFISVDDEIEITKSPH